MADYQNYSRIVAKAWSDAGFRSRLVSDPEKTLQSEGWHLDPAYKIRINDGGDRHEIHLALPKKPEGLSEEQLRDRADLVACCSGGPCC